MKIETETELQHEDLMAVNAAYWADSAAIKLQDCTFTFEGREYLQEPMTSLFRRKCYMKGTQGGASLITILFVLWGLIYKRYKKGVLYLMPTKDDIVEFSQSKFDPLIQDNYSALGRFIHTSQKKGTDKTTLKKIRDAFLFLRPGTLPRKLDTGYSESSRLKGISVDCVVFDELDSMEDQDVVQKALGRCSGSPVKDEIYIGNPGTPKRGIDAVFLDSDQRHWWMRCRKCTEETCAEKEFFDNPNFIKIRNDGSSYLGCKSCGSRIFVKDGYWKPDVKEKSDSLQGYRWSQLIIPFSNPGQILQDYRYPPQGNLGDVMRTKLGMPYLATDDMLTETQAYACCDQNKVMADTNPGPCAMGVDVGDWKHIVIGGRMDNARRNGEDSYEIFKVIRLKDWDDIHDIARRFNVRSAVVDAGPLTDSARKFQRRQKYRVFLCQYNESNLTPIQFNPKTGIVKVNKTQIFDQTGQMIADRKVVFPRKSPAIKEFVKQVTDPVCVEERDKRNGQLIRRYRGREDHYRNALNYFKLAASSTRIGLSSQGTRARERRDTYATNNRNPRRATYATY